MKKIRKKVANTSKTLSEDAIFAIALCFQRALLEQGDLAENLAGLKFEVSDINQLHCTNPPVVKFDEESLENLRELTGEEEEEEDG